VVAACHNSAEGVTVSGPADLVTAFVEELKTEGVFARSVRTGGVAFHSSAMQAVSPEFKKHLEKVIALLFFSLFVARLNWKIFFLLNHCFTMTLSCLDRQVSQGKGR
jgi:hypothetical protein